MLLVDTLTTLISPGNGKAKGKGKSAAAGKPMKEGQRLAEGQWLCKNHVCQWALGRKPNPAGSKRCQNSKCCLLKAEAMNPPQNQRVDPPPPSYSMKTAQANATAAAAKERSAALAKEKVATEAAWKGPEEPTAPATQGQKTAVSQKAAEVMQSCAEQLLNPTKATKSPLTLSAEQLDDFDLLAPSLGPLLASLKEDYLPPPLELPSAEETAQRWIGDSRPCNRAKEKEELQSAINWLKGAMATLDGEEAQQLQPVLSAKEAALARIDKAPSDLESQLAGIIAAAAKFQQAISERKNRMEQAKTRTEERKKARRTFFSQLEEQLTALKEATGELEEEHASLHEQRALAHCKREEEIRQRLEEKIEDLKLTQKKEAEEAEKKKKKEAAQPAYHAQPQEEVADQATRQLLEFQENMRKQLADAAAEAARVQQQHVNQMTALQQQLEQQTTQMRKANEHAKQQALRQEAYETTHVIDEGTLPVLQRPLGEQYAKQSQMLFLLRAWHTSSSSAPVLFQDLVNYSDLGNDAPLLLRTALGSAWAKWFRSEPGLDTVIPRQALHFLLASLEKVKLLCEASEDEQATEHAAAGSFAQMASATKKRRSEVAEVAMGVAPA